MNLAFTGMNPYGWGGGMCAGGLGMYPYGIGMMGGYGGLGMMGMLFGRNRPKPNALTLSITIRNGNDSRE